MEELKKGGRSFGKREDGELKKGGRSFGKGKMENQKREKEEFEQEGVKITNGRSQN